MGRSSTNTKEKLLEAAIDLIWRNSYGAVSVDEICKVAGVQKGSFYHFFPSKLDLTLAALDNFYENSKPFFDKIFHESVPPKERFIKFCELGYQRQKEMKGLYGSVCGCPFMSFGSEMATQEQSVRDKITAAFKKNEAYCQTAIEDMIALGQLPKNIDSKQKASQIYAYLMGCLMMARIQNSLDPLENLQAGIFNILTLDIKQMNDA